MTIRRIPQDFLVNERVRGDVAASWSAEASTGKPIGVYQLRKNSLTTPEGVHWLAKSLGVKDGLVSYAGLKDKHAVTVQHVTVRQPDAKRRASMASEVSGKNGHGWSAKRIGWTDRELAAEAIDGNAFTIVVRDLSREDVQTMNRRMRLLCLPGVAAEGTPLSLPDAAGSDKRLLIANYFGDQRFGSARHGEGWIAEHLVRGEFEHALRLAVATPARKDTGTKRTFTRVAASKWAGADGDRSAWQALVDELPRCPERRAVEALAAGLSFKDAFATLPAFTQQMCVEAFQSHLWNDMVRRAVRLVARGGDGEGSGVEVIATPDAYGELLFMPAARIRGTLLHGSLALPTATVVYDAPWGEIARETLEAARLSLESLTIPGLRRPVFGDASRMLSVSADEFEMSAPEPDDLGGSGKRHRRTLRFVLPRGAYATVVLRALGC